MSTFPFTRNDSPTLGVEIELQLTDPETGALVSGIEAILSEMPEELHAQIKPELMQCYLEINTGVCRNVTEVRADLTDKLRRLHTITDKLGIDLLWSATHPFSSWRDQLVTDNDRYHRLVDLMQDVAKRLVTFGLHLHVGVESGD